jgi:hypothetical protein
MPDNINNDPSVNPAAQIAASQPQPAQPPVTPAAATPTPAVPTQAAPTAAPTQPDPYASARPMNVPADPHDAHVSMFDKILRLVNPGQTYVDPSGNQQVVRNRASLGNSVIASVLAGMMTPTKYREGTYGPVVSGDATVADAYQAGKGQQTAQNEKLQATSDEMQTKKLAVIRNNIDQMHMYAALAQQQHQELQGVADRNNATILKDLGDYDSKQDDPAQKLIKGKGLTLEQAMQMTKGKMSSQNMVIDGYQDVTDADGRTSVQPTFAVINPDAKINMSEASAAELAKYKPAYKNAYVLTGGDIRMPAGQYLSDLHLANSAASLEGFMKRNDDALEAMGIKAKDIDVAAASRNNSRVRQAIVEAENALAQGGEMYQVLDRLQKSPDGATLLTAMGIDPDKAARYVTAQQLKQTSAEALAKEGGQGEKSPADPTQVKNLVDSITNNPDLSASDKKTLLVDVPSADKDGTVHMNKAQVEKLTARTDSVVSSNKSLAEKKAVADGDPVAIAKTAQDILGYGSIDAISKVSGIRGNARQNAQAGIEAKAAELGLNPSRFSLAAMDAKADAVKQYSAGGKVGQQLNSFNTFGAHVAGAKDANDAWQRSGSPLWNKPISYVAENFENDQNYQRFRASVIAPVKEYMSFLNAGHAEHTEDIKKMEDVLDSKTATAQTIYTALQTFAKTADERAKALGETYRDTVGTTFPAIVTKSTVDNLEKLGVKSQAQYVSGTLPRAQSWMTNFQPQVLVKGNPQSDAVVKQFARAAGGDPQKANEMLKEHGFTGPNGGPVIQ